MAGAREINPGSPDGRRNPPTALDSPNQLAILTLADGKRDRWRLQSELSGFTPVTTRPRLLSSAVVGFFIAPVMQVHPDLQIEFNGRLYAPGQIRPAVPWEQLRIGHTVCCDDSGMDISATVVAIERSKVGRNRWQLTRVVADSRF